MDADTVIQNIRNVEIQGATAVATAGVELLQEMAEQGADHSDLEQVAQRLKDARPTEPFLFNAVNMAIESQEYEHILDHIHTTKQDIQKIGAELIDDGNTVFTHCHSSTVTGTLIHAVENGNSLSVHNTETRPLYQGRTTAKELVSAGIPVQHYVDSGARIALKDADVMFLGADAITTTGKVINKIGSEMFVEVAHRHDVPVYVLTDSWKFDARSRFGYHEPLERRIGEEVWPDAPEDVDIVNYAFERIHPDGIDGIVSELGVLTPEGFVQSVQNEYPQIQPVKNA